MKKIIYAILSGIFLAWHCIFYKIEYIEYGQQGNTLADGYFIKKRKWAIIMLCPLNLGLAIIFVAIQGIFKMLKNVCVLIRDYFTTFDNYDMHCISSDTPEPLTAKQKRFIRRQLLDI